ncbi:hypothetical protein I550_0315 [Mycobacterium intracellulare 1956]|uniref:Uncharacterized protein n=1 Tax=Mycobacterium intracellulare 1956 TaxID=1299331 RepID=X8CPJ5_MYCIT|nr:hypothetical protein I550_0315 [Mycobacterium intracellulare 1956]
MIVDHATPDHQLPSENVRSGRAIAMPTFAGAAAESCSKLASSASSRGRAVMRRFRYRRE